MLKFVIICTICLATLFTAQANNKYEVRATWLTTLGGMDWPSQKATSAKSIKLQQAELCRILDKLQAAKFNTVLLQVRLRGDVIYPSYLEGYAECLTGKTGKNPGYDPLQFAIEECHKRGLALHAWMVTIPIGSKRQVKLLKHNSVVAKHASICKLFRGNWYLDPGDPATGNYLSQLVREIVARYDIDGIHFDYLRYPEQGKSFPDYRTYRKYGHQKPLDQWRRDNLTNIVRRLYSEVKELKPWVVVSSSPIGKYDDTKKYRSFGWNALKEVHQDAQLWLKEGIHDALFPMMYFRDNHFYPFALDWQEQKNNRWIVPGMGVYFLETKANQWAIDDIVRQIYFTRDHQLDGQAYFRNQFLMNNAKGIWDELTKRFYTTPAVVPPLSWIDSIAPAAPTLKTFIQESGMNGNSNSGGNSKSGVTTISWQPSATQKAGGISYRIYASDTYPVDTQRGENIMKASHKDCTFTYTAELPWLQKPYWAITATDRYGNESTPVACNKPATTTLPIYSNQLPAIPKGSQLIIADITGKTLHTIAEANESTLETLSPGIYRISKKSPDGSKKLIGTLFKE